MGEMLHRLHVSPYPPEEEIANAITHGLGVILAGVGFYLLLIEVILIGDPWKLWSSVVFGLCMITCYLFSTLYHASTNPSFKHKMRIADHIGIYLLIAGSYTPFVLVSLHGWIGWTYFVLIWGCAVVGITLRIVNMRVPNYVSAAPYLIMGWLAVIGIKPLFDSMGWDGVGLVLLGGIFYSIGVGFYLWERVPFNHAIWHLFVLAGSISHYFAVLFKVIPY
jgi:hemolysin III